MSQVRSYSDERLFALVERTRKAVDAAAANERAVEAIEAQMGVDGRELLEVAALHGLLLAELRRRNAARFGRPSKPLIGPTPN